MINSVEQILSQLEKQPGWEKFREYRQLLKVWNNTVNKNTAQNTRPLHISRQVLWVATNSASRAQELSFQRYTLLKKLNKQLSFSLKDIRFSSSGWCRKTYDNPSRQILFDISPQQRVGKSKENITNLSIYEKELDNVVGKEKKSLKAKNAAKTWLKAIAKKESNSSLLSCPICNSLTPSGELERWNSCYLCIAKKWSEEYRSPTPSGSK